MVGVIGAARVSSGVRLPHSISRPCAATFPKPIPRLDLVFAPQAKDYNGRRTVPLKILDWRTLQAPHSE